MKLSTGPMKVSAGCVDDGNMRSASLGEEEEVQSALTEVTQVEATGQTFGSDESEKENQLLKFDGSDDIAEESSTKLRQRVKQDGKHRSSQMGSSVVDPKSAPMHHCASSLLILVFTVFIITILFALVMGIWR
ncbi:uncharacterized protein LOC111308290 [Durio zibethinus]|uniref:Uncharacterized protein LOC111308290 n=1 Tax=Durio zibethinus TaxID=66656 RepID=A0A6P6AC24_DURZI|nr:uncharacterized protein LOC111308290 [Durio zibethinus]